MPTKGKPSDLGFWGLAYDRGAAFKKGGASYLLNYRYSTLAVLESRASIWQAEPRVIRTSTSKCTFPQRSWYFQSFRPLRYNWFRNEDQTYISSSNHVAGIKQSLIVGERSYVQNTLAFTRLQPMSIGLGRIFKCTASNQRSPDALRLSSY